MKNIILIDKIKLFSDKENAPEWSIPFPFREGENISKEFKSEIESFIKNGNKYIFLSKKAKLFLEDYLQKYSKILFKSNEPIRIRSINRIDKLCSTWHSVMPTWLSTNEMANRKYDQCDRRRRRLRFRWSQRCGQGHQGSSGFRPRHEPGG